MWYRPLNRISLKIVKSFQIIIGNQTPLKLNYMYTEDIDTKMKLPAMLN